MNKQTTFSFVKDYDEQGKHLNEQPVRRKLSACNLNTFSLHNERPIFHEQQGVTLPLCQGEYYATLHDNNLGIARYSLYKITSEQATATQVPRPAGDPWQPNQTPGKLISVTVIIYFFDEEIQEKIKSFLIPLLQRPFVHVALVFHALLMPSIKC